MMRSGQFERVDAEWLTDYGTEWKESARTTALPVYKRLEEE